MRRSTTRLLAKLAALAYEDEETTIAGCRDLGMTSSIFLSCSGRWWQHDTQALITWDALKVVVAFRGTSSFADVLTDLQAWRTKSPGGTAHAGFAGALERIRTALELAVYPLLRSGRELYFTGHSLGGALAQLAAAAFVAQGRRCRLVTWASPRALDHRAARALREGLDAAERWQLNNDVFSRVPFASWGLLTFWRWPAVFVHVGRRRYISRREELWTDPPAWRVFADRLLGRLMHLKEAAAAAALTLTDGLSDHRMQGYVAALEAMKEE